MASIKQSRAGGGPRLTSPGQDPAQDPAQGRPRILPVRVAYRELLPYPLSAYLNPINWALWDTPADTPRLLEELERAMAGEELDNAAAEHGPGAPASIPAPATTPPPPI